MITWPCSTDVPLAGLADLDTAICGDTCVSISVEVLLDVSGSGDPTGGITEAVFTRSPVKSTGTSRVSWNTTDAPAGRSTGTFAISPVPATIPQTPPPMPGLQVQFAETMPAGSGSFTRAPATPNGPLLLTVIV